jgi:sodium/potassium-transporting ATPase subunit alpha
MKFLTGMLSLSKVKNCFRRKKANQVYNVAYDRDYHKLTLEQMESRFSTSSVNGLDQAIAQQLLHKNGKNMLTHKRKNPFLKVIGYFFSGFCTLIWVAAFICILAWKPLGNPSDPANLGLGIMLIIVIALQAAFTAFQDWSSNKVMQSIKKMMPNSATVIRNGKEKIIPVEEIVIGDLVNLSYGTKVPADIRLIESNDLKFDKSMLTGESEPIEGTTEQTDDRYIESKNIAYMTTLITNGQGRGIVIETANATCMGSIACLTNQAEEKKTTLQIELRRFVIIVSCSATFMALVVVVVWASWLRSSYPNYINVSSLMVNTISVMVAFIPEGLPVCVTLALLLIAKRMAKSSVLVKNLTTIETLSCVNVIASDKTGTLTQNKMFVASAAVGLEHIHLQRAVAKSVGLNQLVACSAICNNAKFECDDDTSIIPLNNRKIIGDATDTALLRFSVQYETIQNLKETYITLAEIPFNSRNKWMLKIVRPTNTLNHEEIFTKDAQASDLMLLKGAPDFLLKKCTKIIQSTGEERQLTNQDLIDLIKLQNDLCLDGQRVLLICKKNLERSNFDHSVKDLNACELETFVAKTNDFTVVGLVGIIDPPREGIADVITQCRTAGIRVFMVTGDYALTAAAIALNIGIFTTVEYDTVEEMRLKYKENGKSYAKSALLLTGADLQNFTSEDWRKVTPYEQIVFARTSPEQKLKTVKEFQQDGYIVAVTGDGVNDAPALKSADIGIAMGGGSEVAMDAAQIVLLDNNFNSILVAIKNGRLVFANLKKVILYLLPGGCFAQLIPVLMSIFLGVQQNLSGFQMLIISLFTDIAPSLSLIMEKPEKDLLKQPPRNKHDHIVDWKFLMQAYAFLGVMMAFFSQCMYFWFCQIHGIRLGDILLSFGQRFPNPNNQAQMEIYYTGTTVTFISLVYLQIFGNLLSTRTSFKSFFTQAPWRKPTRNLWCFAAELVSICIMLFIIFVPFFNSYFNTRPVPVQFYFIPLGFCLVIFGADELRKLCVRRKIFFLHKIAW